MFLSLTFPKPLHSIFVLQSYADNFDQGAKKRCAGHDYFPSPEIVLVSKRGSLPKFPRPPSVPFSHINSKDETKKLSKQWENNLHARRGEDLLITLKHSEKTPFFLLTSLNFFCL